MVVWVAITAISVLFMLMMQPDAILAALFVVSMAGIGVAGTHVVWDNIVKLRRFNVAAQPRHRDDDDDRRRTAVAQGKAKRERTDHGRLDRLIETLDDDEIIELESLLMSRGADEPD